MSGGVDPSQMLALITGEMEYDKDDIYFVHASAFSHPSKKLQDPTRISEHNAKQSNWS